MVAVLLEDDGKRSGWAKRPVIGKILSVQQDENTFVLQWWKGRYTTEWKPELLTSGLPYTDTLPFSCIVLVGFQFTEGEEKNKLSSKIRKQMRVLYKEAESKWFVYLLILILTTSEIQCFIENVLFRIYISCHNNHDELTLIWRISLLYYLEIDDLYMPLFPSIWWYFSFFHQIVDFLIGPTFHQFDDFFIYHQFDDFCF